MALLLNNMENRILINDLSTDREFMVFCSEDNQNMELFTYKNIDIHSGKYIGENYDYIMNYIGDRYSFQDIGNSCLIIINSTMNKQEILNNIKWVSSIQKQTILVIRDTTGEGINKKYLKQNYMKYMTFISCTYEIPLDYMDKDYQTEMDYGGVIRFKYLSQKYCKTLVKIAVILTGKPEKMAETALKQAKGGKIIDNRILE